MLALQSKLYGNNEITFSTIRIRLYLGSAAHRRIRPETETYLRIVVGSCVGQPPRGPLKFRLDRQKS